MKEKISVERKNMAAMYMYSAMGSAIDLPKQTFASKADKKPEFGSVGNFYLEKGFLCNTCPTLRRNVRGDFHNTVKFDMSRDLTMEDLYDIKQVRPIDYKIDDSKTVEENLYGIFTSVVQSNQKRLAEFQEKKDNVSLFEKIKSHIVDGRAPYEREVTMTEAICDRAKWFNSYELNQDATAIASTISNISQAVEAGKSGKEIIADLDFEKETSAPELAGD